jgi:hypothetical protein
MMADYKDSEKEAQNPSPASTVKSQNGLEKELQNNEPSTPSSPNNSTLHSRHSSNSVHRVDSDTFEPLERTRSTHERIPADQFPHPYLQRTRTGISIGTTGSRPPDFEIDFEPDDSDNPKCWPVWYRGIVIVTISFSTWVVVLYSTSYTAAMPGMMREWGIDNEPLTTMGITFYLLGLAVGSMVLAPASELYGRRRVYTVALLLFTLLVIPCALATSLSQVLVLRFLGYAESYPSLPDIEFGTIKLTLP